MQLTYRGNRYSYSVSSIETDDTQEKGLFLGAQYTRKQSHFPRTQKAGEELIFLGRRYTR